MNRFLPIFLVSAILLGLTLLSGASAGEQYERSHLEYLNQQNKLLEKQNELLRDQIAQLKRIADLIEKGRR